jgi:hypothetical protein
MENFSSCCAYGYSLGSVLFECELSTCLEGTPSDFMTVDFFALVFRTRYRAILGSTYHCSANRPKLPLPQVTRPLQRIMPGFTLPYLLPTDRVRTYLRYMERHPYQRHPGLSGPRKRKKVSMC